MNASELQIVIEAIDKAFKPLNKVIGQVEKLDQIGRKMAATGAIVTGFTAPLVAGIGLATKSAIGLESSLLGVMKITGMAGEQADEFTDALQNISRATGVATTDLAMIAEGGARLGKSGAELLTFTDNVTKLSVALDIGHAQMLEFYSATSQVLQLDDAGMLEFADVVNWLADSTGTSADKVFEFAQRVGVAGKQSGMTAKEIAVLGAVLTEAGIAPERAATSIEGILSTLANLEAFTPKMISGLDMLNLSLEDLQALPTADRLEVIRQSMKDLDDQQKQVVSGLLFGRGGDSQAMALLASDADRLNEVMRELEAAGYGAGGAMAEFNRVINSESGALSRLNTAMSTFGEELGMAVLPLIEKIVPKITEMINQLSLFVENNPRITQLGVAAVGAVAGVAALAVAVGGLAIAFGALSVPVLIFLGVIALLIAAAAAIIIYWEPIKKFFADLWLGITYSATQAWNWIREKAVEAFKAVVQWGQNMWQRLVENFNTLKGKIIGTLAGLATSALQKGKDIVRAIADGILAGIQWVRDAISSVVQAVTDRLPGSPVRLGPLKVLNDIGNNPGAEIVKMLSAGVESSLPGLQGILNQGLSIGLEGGSGLGSVPPVNRPRESVRGGGDQITINFSPQIEAGSGADGAAIVQALRDYMPEFQALMSDYFGERSRVGFS